MAAGSSVVDLCTLADARLDAATSSKFFRDDDDGAAARGATTTTTISSSFSWPEAGRTPSRLFDQMTLLALCAKHKVPTDYTPLSLDGRWRACDTPAAAADTIFVYAGALEAGTRVPLHDFYSEVLAHYGLAPSQLAPDAWRHLAAFVLLSHDAGVDPPSLPAFRSFFSICTHDGDSVGWHHFTPRRSGGGSHGCRLLLFNAKKMPRSPDPEWKSRFFMLRSPSATPWPCPVRWGKPSRAAVRAPVVTPDIDMVMKKLLDRVGSSGIDVVQFLSRRSLPVVASPAAQQKHKPVQVGATAAAAAAPPPPPPLPVQQEATRKRKSISDTDTQGWGLVDCIAEASELARAAMAELDDKGKELLATRAEVAQLKDALRAANAEVRRLADDHRKAAERAAAEHAEQVKAERAAQEELKKEHAAAVSQLIGRFKKDHVAAVARLKEEHAAEVAAVEDAADKKLQEAKKKIVLRLFPKLDVCLLERPKLRGDLAAAAAAGTPKGEERS